MTPSDLCCVGHAICTYTRSSCSINQEYQKFVLSVKRFKQDISKHKTKYTRMYIYMYAKKLYYTIYVQKKRKFFFNCLKTLLRIY